MAHDALLLAIPVGLFVVHSLVVMGLAFGQRDFTFYQVMLPIQRGADAGETLLVDAGLEIVEFALV